MYASIVARLGVVCLPINFPGHFMLKWLEHPSEQENNHKYTFIDAFAGGKQMTELQVSVAIIVSNVITSSSSSGQGNGSTPGDPR